ncbi:hypothetical protein [Allobranchiibius sp. CTAmp26]|uniref:hypothetical protein n=1 Tax=Allobranchiibius sp. CTAmp26 TaxID=2815214 RepID=UPI001AA12316|nr:hypothetical protein [Allobranchiibius sp. CTAmp26]MBO1754135.1 hypothetical protein [Allobranchiibius sp. CTAmp26]
MGATPGVHAGAGDTAGHDRASERSGSFLTVVVLRVLGAAGLLGNGWVHYHLWDQGYRDIKTIGPLFLLDAIAAVVLALLVLVAPRRILPLAALVGFLMQVGTIAALVITTKRGLFGFTESTKAPDYWESVWVESIGALVLLLLVGYTVSRLRTRTATRRW